MQGFILQNEVSAISSTQLSTMAGDLALQLVELATWWQRTPLAVRLDTPLAFPEEWSTAVIVQTLDDPEALAYHSVDARGRPYVEIGYGVTMANGGTLWGIGESILSAISHEFCETAVDPYCDFNVDMFDGVTETPVEACDGTQGDTYEMVPGTGRYVSNFLGPRWFGPENGAGPYDRMGLCTKPRELRPGGYLSIRRGGVWDNVFGMHAPAHLMKGKMAGQTRRTRGRPLSGSRMGLLAGGS